MEFERSMFRIYERVLKSENFELWTKILSLVFTTFSLFSLIVLLYFHISFINNTEALSSAISSQLLEGSKGYTSKDLNLTLSGHKTTTNKTLLPEDIYNITIGTSIKYQFSVYFQVLLMPKEVKERVNFTEHELNFQYEDFFPKFFLPLFIVYNELDTVIINQLAGVFSENQGFLKNSNSKEVWAWHEGQFKLESNPGLFQRTLSFFKSVLLFMLLSLVTGLICRMAIAGSAGIMISLSWCMEFFNANENNRLILFYSFPWAGQPAFALRNENKGIGFLVLSFFLMLVVFYFMYACTYLLWTPMIFGNSYPFGLDERVYTMFSLVEFFSLIFVRCKITVNWFPKVVLVFLGSFFLYRKNNFYPFLNTYFAFVTWGILAAMVGMLKFVEKPIFLDDGPTFESPRLVYQPVFQRTQVGLPDIWTLFYPVAGRGEFTEEQMSRIYPVQAAI